MDLFLSHNSKNHLPYDGLVIYLGSIFPQASSIDYFQRLKKEVDWRPDQVVLYGKRILTKRLVSWVGDSPFTYKYSGIAKSASPWTPSILELKKEVEALSGETFNSCLLNFYENGKESMSWHSDEERELLRNGTIASLSFGSERRFLFRHKKTQEKREILLESGSLLLMKGETQTHWQHSLPKMERVSLPRINLTFRSFVGNP